MRRFQFLLILLALGGCHASARKAVPIWEQSQVTRKIEEPEADPARMVPADARWYVRVDNLPEWFDETSGDPLARHLWSVVKSFQPPTLWKTGSEKLGLSNNQAVHVYFGKTVALVDQEIGDKHGVVVMSRAEEADLGKLPEVMGLKPFGKPDRIGPFRTWSASEEGKEYVFGIGKRWLMITEAPYADHMRRVLAAVAAGEKALADHERFNGLLAKMPERETKPDGVVLVRDTHPEKPDDCHALTMRRRGEALEVDYVAESAELTEYLKDSQEVPGVDFGPMPDSVITAITVNILQMSPPWTGGLNVFLFPHSFRKNVRPAITPPIVAFLASLPPDRVEPNPGVSVPVVGLAVRMTDPKVAGDLDRIVKGLHFLLSATRLDLAKGFFGVDHVQQDGLDYHIADFGPAIQNKIDDDNVRRLTELPSSAGLTKVTFGRIGDDYVICTQEAFFHDWDVARREGGHRLDGRADYAELGLEPRPHLLASFLTRAPELGALLKDVADYWKKAQESGGPPPRKGKPPPPEKGEKGKEKPEEEPRREEGIEQPLRWVAEGLGHRRSFSLQVWRDEEQRLWGHLLIAPNEGREDESARRAPSPAPPTTPAG